MALNFKDYTLLKKEYIKSINLMLDECEDLGFIETIKRCLEEKETFKSIFEGKK